MEVFFQRTLLLLGKEFMERLSSVKIIIFGLGGVGSWCAESLIRSGLLHLTIVDFDNICITNINRQSMANSTTIGQKKTKVLKKQLLTINPEAQIMDLQMIYNSSNSDFFQLNNYDYIIDAIDSVQNKVHLLQTATQTKAQVFSSMGAALKISPERIKVSEFWKVSGCPLAAALRKRFKKFGMPSKKFLCVYSDELLENKGQNENYETNTLINGSLVHITAIFGFTLAGLVLKDIENCSKL